MFDKKSINEPLQGECDITGVISQIGSLSFTRGAAGLVYIWNLKN